MVAPAKFRQKYLFMSSSVAIDLCEYSNPKAKVNAFRIRTNFRVGVQVCLLLTRWNVCMHLTSSLHCGQQHCYCLSDPLHCRQHTLLLSDWLATLSAVYITIVWLALYTVGSMCCHCLTDFLHCPQHTLSLSDQLATLSAAYVAIVWLARYTVGSMCCHCLTVSLHCRQHTLLLSNQLATRSAAYAAIVWLTRYTVGSICYTCSTDPLPSQLVASQFAFFGRIFCHCLIGSLHRLLLILIPTSTICAPLLRSYAHFSL